jgi:hypothetical protein
MTRVSLWLIDLYIAKFITNDASHTSLQQERPIALEQNKPQAPALCCFQETEPIMRPHPGRKV